MMSAFAGFEIFTSVTSQRNFFQGSATASAGGLK